MSTTTISMTRGDNHEINITVKDQVGTVVNITGARIRFTTQTLPTDLAKDSNNGVSEVELTDAVNGVAQIKIVPNDTAGSTPKEPGSYLFDIEMQLGGKTHTLEKGFFKLEADVTT